MVNRTLTNIESLHIKFCRISYQSKNLIQEKLSSRKLGMDILKFLNLNKEIALLLIIGNKAVIHVKNCEKYF